MKVRPLLYARGVVAAARLLHDPNKLEEVFALDRAIEAEAKIRVLDQVKTTREGARAIAERHRITVDLETLRLLEEGTFGRAMADFCDANGIVPSAIPKLPAKTDGDYVQAHLYETHDIWHVALGFGTSVSEELGLQAVYAVQLRDPRLAPLLLAGGLLQSALWVRDDFVPRLAAIARGYEIGTHAIPLFGVRWDEMWTLPLEEVRASVLT